MAFSSSHDSYATIRRMGQCYEDLEPKSQMRRKEEEGEYLFYQLLCLMENKD